MSCWVWALSMFTFWKGVARSTKPSPVLQCLWSKKEAVKPCLDLKVERATKTPRPLSVNLLGKDKKQKIMVLWRGKYFLYRNAHRAFSVWHIYQLPCVIWYQECVHRENIWLLYTLRFQVTVKCNYEPLLFFRTQMKCVFLTKKTRETECYPKNIWS